MKSIRLSSAQAAYVKRADFLPWHVREQAKPLLGSGVIDIAAEMADECQASLTTRLVSVGFDEDYEPTSEGQMLESLIDAFGP